MTDLPEGGIARILDEWVVELERDETPVRTERLDVWIAELFALRAVQRRLRDVLDDLEDRVARAVPHGEQVEHAGRRWRVTRETRRRNWDDDGLLRAVLDSRRVDRDTGVVVDETPIEKIRHVWRLSGRDARLGALRDRGIDDDEFCEVERGRLRFTEVR